ncbi:hypothetical protein FKP32DRAFT_1589204 [Trametes sanguinea]|nr:hypothetical protein FKP32DRAFT_1589204 [Trametes sanguinea]
MPWPRIRCGPDAHFCAVLLVEQTSALTVCGGGSSHASVTQRASLDAPWREGCGGWRLQSLYKQEQINMRAFDELVAHWQAAHWDEWFSLEMADPSKKHNFAHVERIRTSRPPCS